MGLFGRNRGANWQTGAAAPTGGKGLWKKAKHPGFKDEKQAARGGTRRAAVRGTATEIVVGKLERRHDPVKAKRATEPKKRREEKPTTKKSLWRKRALWDSLASGRPTASRGRIRNVSGLLSKVGLRALLTGKLREKWKEKRSGGLAGSLTEGMVFSGGVIRGCYESTKHLRHYHRNFSYQDPGFAPIY